MTSRTRWAFAGPTRTGTERARDTLDGAGGRPSLCMMLIPVRIDRSPVHGMGLFAAAAVPRGTPVWRFEPGFDREFSMADFDRLPLQARTHLRHYGYLDGSSATWVLGGDLSIFMNHSPAPNTGAPEVAGAAAMTVALRDLEAGEELTCDYRAFDASEKPIPGPLHSSRP